MYIYAVLFSCSTILVPRLNNYNIGRISMTFGSVMILRGFSPMALVLQKGPVWRIQVDLFTEMEFDIVNYVFISV